ncbi:MAG: c-type cytochrome, partial [Woeseia sp.]
MTSFTQRNKHLLLPTVAGMLLASSGSASAQAAAEVHNAETQQGQAMEALLAQGKTVYQTNCAACHQPTGMGLPGAFPPLANSDFLKRDRKEVLSVALFGLSGPITVNDKEYNSVMPSMGYLSDEDLAAAMTYVFSSWGNNYAAVSVAEVAALRTSLGQQDRAEGERHTGTTEGEMRYKGAPSAIPPEDTRAVMDVDGPVLSEAEYATATKVYFQRCAGCHGVLRKGATGKPLTPDITRTKGTDYLKALITYGSPAGMPNWGTSGELTETEIDILARFLQQEPPEPPEFGMEDMRATWKLLVPPEERPTKPQHKRNTDNYFAVTLRDAGKVAIIDGDTKEIVGILPTGYAVHIS